MNPTFITIPIALLTSLVIAKLLLMTLHQPDSVLSLLAAAAACTGMLFRRQAWEIALVAILTLLALPGTRSVEVLGLADDVFLSMALAVVFLPLLMRLLGFEQVQRIKGGS